MIIFLNILLGLLAVVFYLFIGFGVICIISMIENGPLGDSNSFELDDADFGICLAIWPLLSLIFLIVFPGKCFRVLYQKVISG